MSERFYRWVSQWMPPSGADNAADHSRQAAMFVRAILIPGIIALTLDLVADQIWPSPHARVTNIVLVTLLVWCFVGLFLLRRGHAAVGSVTILLIWAASATLMWLGQGVRDVVTLMQVIAFMVAGLMGWPRLTIAMVLATIVNLVALGAVEERGLRLFEGDSTWAVVRDASLMMLMLGFVIMLYARGMVASRRRMLADLAHREQVEQERKQLLECERLARAQAEEASLSKDRFVATLSHELRTPLTPVLMSLSAMEADSALATPVRQEARVMRQNIQIEMRLIDDLLDLSRARFGKLRLDRRPCSVVELVEDVIRICHSDLAAREISVVRQFAGHARGVLVDADRLRQVFWNLLRNATRFTPAGGTITIRTHMAHRDGQDLICVEVIDSGPGIDTELMPRLFGLFEQGKDSGHSRGGLGVGLAISRTIVQEHGGDLTASNDAAGGACFRVELPCAPEQQSEPSAPPEEMADRPVPSMRILFVEDDRVTGAVFERILSGMGHQVTLATSLARARAAIEGESRFDLLISDIGLPDGSGLEVMPLFARVCGGPGVALSGFGTDQDIAASTSAGFARHLVKPVSVNQLTAAVGEVMAGEACPSTFSDVAAAS